MAKKSKVCRRVLVPHELGANDYAIAWMLTYDPEDLSWNYIPENAQKWDEMFKDFIKNYGDHGMEAMWNELQEEWYGYETPVIFAEYTREQFLGLVANLVRRSFPRIAEYGNP